MGSSPQGGLGIQNGDTDPAPYPVGLTLTAGGDMIMSTTNESGRLVPCPGSLDRTLTFHETRPVRAFGGLLPFFNCKRWCCGLSGRVKNFLLFFSRISGISKIESIGMCQTRKACSPDVYNCFIIKSTLRP